MPRRSVLLLALITLMAFPLRPATLVRCGKLLDVAGGELLSGAAILIDGDKVLAAGPASSITTAATGAIDLSSATCLPGLIEVHDHLTNDPSNSGYQGLGISVPRSTVTGVKNARLTLRAGFTTVRNVGASGYSDV